MMLGLEFYKSKKVLVTGHTGFKGSWLCKMLVRAGADVVGYALRPQEGPNLFEIARLESTMQSIYGDIRDFEQLRTIFASVKPEIVFHLAAQPIVRESYISPAYTYETNVMGTVNVLECIRATESVCSFLNVTTDKVYENREHANSFSEEDSLNGYDPYSNSKSCSELVTSSYKKSFFPDGRCAISTARSGNVIGGGDFSKDRIVPDCIRAAEKGETIIVRNPHSVRPYQHVLDPLSVYLMIAEKQHKNPQFAGCYNVGPDERDCLTTGALVTLFCQKWGNNLTWMTKREQNAPHEASYLKLNCNKLKNTFGWQPHWNIETAIEHVVDWTKTYFHNEDISAYMDREIDSFIKGVS